MENDPRITRLENLRARLIFLSRRDLNPKNRRDLDRLSRNVDALLASRQKKSAGPSRPSAPDNPSPLNGELSHPTGVLGSQTERLETPLKPQEYSKSDPTETQSRFRNWLMIIGSGLFLVPIVKGPAWPTDFKTQLGLVLLGAGVGATTVAMVFILFAFLSQKAFHRNAFAYIRRNPISAFFDILFFATAALFFGILYAASIGVGPERSHLFWIIPLSWLVAFIARK